MFAVKAKLYGVLYKQSALSRLMKHLVIGQHLKTPNFSDFNWSPRSSLVSTGQHFVATRVIHLLKSTETSLITKSDQSGPITIYCSYARPAQPGPIRTRLCGPCMLVCDYKSDDLPPQITVVCTVFPILMHFFTFQTVILCTF